MKSKKAGINCCVRSIIYKLNSVLHFHFTFSHWPLLNNCIGGVFGRIVNETLLSHLPLWFVAKLTLVLVCWEKNCLFVNLLMACFPFTTSNIFFCFLVECRFKCSLLIQTFISFYRQAIQRFCLRRPTVNGSGRHGAKEFRLKPFWW